MDSGSEDERTLRAENKARREEAAKAKEAADLAAREARKKGRKRKSLAVTGQVTTVPLTTSSGSGTQATAVQAAKKAKKVASAPEVVPQGTPVTLEAITASMGSAIASGMSATMTQMMEQQQKQHEAMKSYVVPKKTMGAAGDEEDDAIEEEETVMVDEVIQLKDNSVDVLDFVTRGKLRVPNGSADTWWGKTSVSQRVCRPIRGSSLYLENIQGATRPNDDTCKKVS